MCFTYFYTMIFTSVNTHFINRMNALGASRQPFFFIISFDLNQGCVLKPDEINPDELVFSINQQSNCQCNSGDNISGSCTFSKYPIPFAVYQEMFDMVMKHILRGDSYLVNLTCATPIETNLDLHQIYDRSNAKYKLWIKDRLVVFSPETFVQIRGNQIFSFPMKGTIDAGIMNASDEILNNRKEAAEHATIVDLIRNDLAMVADHVKVEDYRFIDKITTHQGDLLQVSSKISGQLTDGFYNHLGDILFKLLPAGSISGAPKPKTLRIIQQAETYQRGFYTGIMGYFDGENIDSGVMIRFIEQTANGLIFKSGGGITCLSKAREEYDEMVRKVYLPF